MHSSLPSHVKLLSLSVILTFITLLVQAQSGPISGKITNARGEPVPGVNITIKGKTTGTTTNANGDFSINAAEGDVLIISAVGWKPQEQRVSGSQRITVNLQEAITELSTVVVGSRSLRPRSNLESPVPVDVVTSQALQATGQIEPTQQLQYSAPSFTANRQNLSDGSDHIDPASLRSLGPDQVLILVNGKRRYNTALININGTVGKGSVGTDLNAIPSAAIDRIEVLRDGAASQYGSDAIAGVINIVLKKRLGTQVFTHGGQNYAGDGATLTLGVNHGLKIGKKGGLLNITGEIRHRQPSNRAGDYLGTVFVNNATDADSIAKYGGFNRSDNLLVGNSKQLNAYGEASLELPLSTNSKFYLTGMYSYRKGKAAGFYRYPKQIQQVVLSKYPKGFLPMIESTIQDKSVIAGVKGKTGSGWNWDLSNTWGGNSFRFDVSNSNNASLQAASPTEFYCGTLSFMQNTTNVDLSKDFGEKLNLLSFNVAAGAELRFDNYKIEAGEEASWKNYDPAKYAGGAQVFPGFQPTNAVNETRNVLSAYVDVESDLTKKFLVNVAGRFERYSDFGSAVAGKLAMRYKVADALTIRGSVTNGFRSPSIHQYFFSNISTIFQATPTGLVASNTMTVRNSDPIAKTLGIPELTKETSVSYSLGITSQLGKIVSLSVDAYQINIDDRILLAGPFRRDTAIVKTILDAANVDPEVRVVTAFANIIDTKTRGVDIILTVSPPIGKGKLDFTFAANFNKTTIQSVKGTEKIPPVRASTGNYFFFDRIEESRIERANPREKLSLAAAYQLDKFGINIRATRFGEVTIWHTNKAMDETYGARTVTDASINYAITPQLKITVGANNIFDVYPEKLKWFTEGNGNTSNPLYGNTGEGRFVYSRNVTQFGMNGGYYYASLGFTL